MCGIVPVATAATRVRRINGIGKRDDVSKNGIENELTKQEKHRQRRSPSRADPVHTRLSVLSG